VPTRILDTRPSGQTGYAGDEPAPDSVIPVQIVGVAGVTESATAAVLNLTATEATAPGFVTVWPTGADRPTASNLNLEHSGQTIANQVIVPIGADGTVSIYTQSGAHLIVDIAGYFTPTSLYTPLTPARVLDTRPSSAIASDGAKPAPGEAITVTIAGHGGAPAAGAATAVVNLTDTETDAPGFFTVWPSDQPQPLASNLNADQAGQTIANLVVVPIAPDGTITIFTQTGAHLIADLVGYA
jgi:hypothetical protein